MPGPADARTAPSPQISFASGFLSAGCPIFRRKRRSEGPTSPDRPGMPPHGIVLRRDGDEAEAALAVERESGLAGDQPSNAVAQQLRPPAGTEAGIVVTAQERHEVGAGGEQRRVDRSSRASWLTHAEISATAGRRVRSRSSAVAGTEGGGASLPSRTAARISSAMAPLACRSSTPRDWLSSRSVRRSALGDPEHGEVGQHLTHRDVDAHRPPFPPRGHRSGDPASTRAATCGSPSAGATPRRGRPRSPASCGAPRTLRRPSRSGRDAASLAASRSCTSRRYSTSTAAYCIWSSDSGRRSQSVSRSPFGGDTPISPWSSDTNDGVP